VKRINVEHINSHSTFWNFQSDFWDFHPSWQNSVEAIQRASDDFVGLGVFDERKLVGYCVFEPASGDLTQIAVDKEYRRKGIATLLLREVIKLNRHDSIKILNSDVLHSSITDFLIANNIPLIVKQFEMIKEI
jgi:ribosomal protein S18 acetylase RimI-like enzyme